MQSSTENKCVRRISGLHGIRFHTLFRDHFSNTLYDAAIRRISGMNSETCYTLFRDHSVSVSATFAALEDVC